MFTIKQGDTRPKLVAVLSESGTPIDLTTATSVKLLMRVTGSVGAAKVDAAATITSAAAGEVTYTWLAADTDTAGTYDAEWEITWSDGGIETVPNDGYFTVVVGDDIA
jgi:hypothetical protein